MKKLTLTLILALTIPAQAQTAAQVLAAYNAGVLDVSPVDSLNDQADGRLGNPVFSGDGLLSLARSTNSQNLSFGEFGKAIPFSWLRSMGRSSLTSQPGERKTFNARLDAYTSTPVHDQYSHGADAVRYLAVRHKGPAERRRRLDAPLKENFAWG